MSKIKNHTQKFRRYKLSNGVIIIFAIVFILFLLSLTSTNMSRNFSEHEAQAHVTQP
mgnify:FL=1